MSVLGVFFERTLAFSVGANAPATLKLHNWINYAKFSGERKDVSFNFNAPESQQESGFYLFIPLLHIDSATLSEEETHFFI